MPNVDKSVIAPNNSTGNAQTTSSIYDCLTKAELIQILESNITEPLSPQDLHRCAISVVCQWCADVVAGRHASLVEVENRLRTLENIYTHRR